MKISRFREILKEELKSILEAKQVGVLYHYTSVIRAIKIIQSNILKATDGFNNNEEEHIGYTKATHRDYSGKVISLTRDKTKYNFIIGDEAEIGFVIDGNKLSNNYKIIPFHDEINNEDEQEERIYNRDITNFISYINKVIIYKTKYIDDIEVSDLIELLENKNIPYEIQDDPKMTKATKKIHDYRLSKDNDYES